MLTVVALILLLLIVGSDFKAFVIIFQMLGLLLLLLIGCILFIYLLLVGRF
jgi:hypothetical protein